MKTITIRFNDEEVKQIETIQEILMLKGQFGEDSRAIKAALNFTMNVLPNMFGGNIGQIFYSKIKKKDMWERATGK